MSLSVSASDFPHSCAPSDATRVEVETDTGSLDCCPCALFPLPAHWQLTRWLAGWQAGKLEARLGWKLAGSCAFPQAEREEEPDSDRRLLSPCNPHNAHAFPKSHRQHTASILSLSSASAPSQRVPCTAFVTHCRPLPVAELCLPRSDAQIQLHLYFFLTVIDHPANSPHQRLVLSSQPTQSSGNPSMVASSSKHPDNRSSR